MNPEEGQSGPSIFYPVGKKSLLLGSKVEKSLLSASTSDDSKLDYSSALTIKKTRKEAPVRPRAPLYVGRKADKATRELLAGIRNNEERITGMVITKT